MGVELFFRNLKYLARYNLKGMYNHASTEHDDRLLMKVLSVQENLSTCTDRKVEIGILDAPF